MVLILISILYIRRNGVIVEKQKHGLSKTYFGKCYFFLYKIKWVNSIELTFERFFVFNMEIWVEVRQQKKV